MQDSPVGQMISPSPSGDTPCTTLHSTSMLTKASTRMCYFPQPAGGPPHHWQDLRILGKLMASNGWILASCLGLVITYRVCFGHHKGLERVRL
ncbi:LOW QUALITY PROTEIN: hypothetical protein CKAN_02783500 [Cinnamomum micranthum f. kanehirae]|uniref:Uncharacterized protein n=1 Tax=Cinnamomum micranthum f. kanehirae TaxID=337451 RepID=A0A3S3RBH9_9MAGN|nr:LOW QUALITY PROTEIN: hypothetical protein CKAN_02783500 [Cinnamomum micranthum f. kanehirae]